MHSLRPFQRTSSCDNMNHRRPNSPVGFCPQCGGPVNRSVASMGCDGDKHAAARRRQSAYCVDCGEKLIATFLK